MEKPAKLKWVVWVWGLPLVFFLLYLGLIVIEDFIGSPKRGRHAACNQNLRQIGRASLIYAGEHDGKLPDDLSELYPKSLPDMSVFLCPEAALKHKAKLGDFSYQCEPKLRLTPLESSPSASRDAAIFAYEKEFYHDNFAEPMRMGLDTDGYVIYVMNMTEKELLKQLAKQREGLQKNPLPVETKKELEK